MSPNPVTKDLSTASPLTEATLSHSDRSRVACRVVCVGLAIYTACQLLSTPLAWMASRIWESSTYKHGIDPAYADLAAFFHFTRAAGDVGLIVAIVAGYVWLYAAWARAHATAKKRTIGPGAVVVRSLVPVWGYWQLYKFLLELSRRAGARQDSLGVGRWWVVTAAHVLVRASVSHAVLVGGLHIFDGLLAATAAILGIRMVLALERT